MRRGAWAALATLLVGVSPLSWSADFDPRSDVETMEALLDRVVRRVSEPSAAPFFGASEASRAYRLQGYGVVFVVPPRSLPPSQHLGELPGDDAFATASLGPGVPPSGADDELRRAFAQEESVRKSLAAERPQGGRARMARERELKSIEAKVDALSREAERQRAEAERALDVFMQRARVRLMARTPAGAAEGPTAAPAQGEPSPEAEPPLPPAPPWRFWLNGEGVDDPRKPDQVVSDVKAAVLQALEAAGGRLRSVRPEESVVVAVDFVPQWDFGDGATVEHTLVVRAKKKDLEEHDQGKLSTTDLRKRMELVEY
jgi:hypothetical protein